MSTIIQQIEQEQMQGKEIPVFFPGDTVVVYVKVMEAKRERLQAFEGVVIAVKHRGLNSAFTVRKISHGEGVERVFQTYSPQIGRIEVKRHGSVNRAKLYYLRDLRGRKARITEKLKAAGIAQEEIQAIEAVQAEEVAHKEALLKAKLEAQQVHAEEEREAKEKAETEKMHRAEVRAAKEAAKHKDDEDTSE